MVLFCCARACASMRPVPSVQLVGVRVAGADKLCAWVACDCVQGGLGWHACHRAEELILHGNKFIDSNQA
jgi:hypothetical protein